MEPDVMPIHSSPPPPLDDGGDEDEEDGDDGDVGSEEDEFGGFSVSCSPLGFASSTEPPSSLRPPPKLAPHQPCSSFTHPVRQSQPASSLSSGFSSGQMRVEAKDGYAGTPALLAGGRYERDRVCYSASVDGASSPQEETGFADFTVFTAQAAQPWCCGLSPIGSTEHWGEKVEGRKLSEEICNPGKQVILDSEPRPHGAHGGDVCTEVKHCERRHPALEEASQDHRRPQEAAAALGFVMGRSLDEAEEQREGREKTVSILPQTFSLHDAASEDLGSFSDDFSFEGVSADLEPNVSSLTSREDQQDWNKTDDEDEELENCEHFDCSVNDSIEDLRQPEAEMCLHLYNKSASQESSATSSLCGVQLHSAANAEDQCLDFSHSRFNCQQHLEQGGGGLGSLPPSDSFADFCSAPAQEDDDGSWAEFKDQKTQEKSKTCTRFREQVGSPPSDEETEEEGAGQRDVRRSSCEASLLHRVQQLLQASFPEAVAPATDDDEFLSLDALLHTQHLPENEREEEAIELSAQWMQRGPWWPQQDAHSAVGLRFQWGGSHTNRTLLSCLGVDTHNILFIGTKKQPVTVPAFASGLGLLEPTKDSVPAVRSLQHTAVTAPTPPGPQEIPDPSRDSTQGVLPSSQSDWGSRGLSSSQDGMSPRRVPHFWGRK